MKTYLDSSVILERILGTRGAAELWRTVERPVTSALTQTECLRALDRVRVAGGMDEEELIQARVSLFRILETGEIVALGRPVLERASYPTPITVGTFDAIHLASAAIYREAIGPLNLATHGRALALAARSMGFEVLGAS